MLKKQIHQKEIQLGYWFGGAGNGLILATKLVKVYEWHSSTVHKHTHTHEYTDVLSAH